MPSAKREGVASTPGYGVAGYGPTQGVTWWVAMSPSLNVLSLSQHCMLVGGAELA